jgi:hypothetical protein
MPREAYVKCSHSASASSACLVVAYAAETGLLVSAFEDATMARWPSPRALARRQASAPSPLPPPVMATTRPASLMTVSLLSWRESSYLFIFPNLYWFQSATHRRGGSPC